MTHGYSNRFSMKFKYFALVVLLWSVSVLAEDSEIKRLKANLAKTFPEASQGMVRPSPMPGFYELVLDTKIYYLNAGGTYLLVGDLVDIKSRTNLTEKARQTLAKRLIDEMGEQNMIVLAPKETRHTITVFTDVDCPYCARLHQDVPELNRHGIKVRYLLYPRSGKDSETYRRSVAVWCATDRVKAVGIAKNGGKLEQRKCTNPVDRHYQLGERIGISGTPTIFLENGKKIPGYIPAAQLTSVIQQQAVLDGKAALLRDPER